ncbi:hypothetical protein N2152v2_005823 [Parachlorella kessleri]
MLINYQRSLLSLSGLSKGVAAAPRTSVTWRPAKQRWGGPGAAQPPYSSSSSSLTATGAVIDTPKIFKGEDDRDLDQPAAQFDSIPDALAAVARGECVVVLDDESRENEGDLICAADRVTEQTMAFIVEHTSGVVCVGMEGADLDRLRLPLMVNSAENEEAMYTAFTVTVDVREGTSTGISAADRALTLRALANADSRPEEFKRPGHIFPLRYRQGGVLRRPGHTEASVDLMRLAGCRPAGALCEIVNKDGSMARTPQLLEFARRHGLKCITILDLVRYRLKHDALVECTAVAPLSTRYGEFTARAYRSLLDGTEHVVLVAGQVEGAEACLVRVQSESLLGDVFGSLHCNSGSQLDTALRQIAEEGCGVLVYLRGQQGRGLGVADELEAYASTESHNCQTNGSTTVPVDLREYGVAAHILRDLGVGSIRLMTNNPAKLNSLKAYGFQVSERLPLLPGAVAAVGAAPVQPSKPKVPAAHSPARHRNGSDPHFV